MEDTKDAYPVFEHNVGGYVRRVWDYQFTYACDSSLPSALWEIDEPPDSKSDFLIDVNGSAWIFGFNVSENIISVG